MRTLRMSNASPHEPYACSNWPPTPTHPPTVTSHSASFGARPGGRLRCRGRCAYDPRLRLRLGLAGGGGSSSRAAGWCLSTDRRPPRAPGSASPKQRHTRSGRRARDWRTPAPLRSAASRRHNRTLFWLVFLDEPAMASRVSSPQRALLGWRCSCVGGKRAERSTRPPRVRSRSSQATQSDASRSAPEPAGGR